MAYLLWSDGSPSSRLPRRPLQERSPAVAEHLPPLVSATQRSMHPCHSAPALTPSAPSQGTRWPTCKGPNTAGRSTLSISGEAFLTPQLGSETECLRELPPGFCMSRPSQQALLRPALAVQQVGGRQASKVSGRVPGQPDPLLRVAPLADWLVQMGLLAEEKLRTALPSVAEGAQAGSSRASVTVVGQGLGHGHLPARAKDGEVVHYLQQLARMSLEELGLDQAAQEDLRIVKLTLHDRAALRRLRAMLKPGVLERLVRKAEALEGWRPKVPRVCTPHRRGRRTSRARAQNSQNAGEAAGGDRGTGTVSHADSPETASSGSCGEEVDAEGLKSEDGESSSSRAVSRGSRKGGAGEQEEAAEGTALDCLAAEEEKNGGDCPSEAQESNEGPEDDAEEERPREQAQARPEPILLFTVKARHSQETLAGQEPMCLKRRLFPRLWSGQQAGAVAAPEERPPKEWVPPAAEEQSFMADPAWVRLRDDLASDFRNAIDESWARAAKSPEDGDLTVS